MIERFGWFGIHLTINQDPEEAIKQAAGHTGEVNSSENLFVANSVSEVIGALNELGVRI